MIACSRRVIESGASEPSGYRRPARIRPLERPGRTRPSSSSQVSCRGQPAERHPPVGLDCGATSEPACRFAGQSVPRSRDSPCIWNPFARNPSLTSVAHRGWPDRRPRRVEALVRGYGRARQRRAPGLGVRAWPLQSR